jgi:3-methyladenine DNA glycosylase AlkC
MGAIQNFFFISSKMKDIYRCMEAIKDHFRKEKIEELAKRFHSVDENFDHTEFVNRSATNLDTLEYRERVAQIADSLWKLFPDYEAFYQSALPVLEKWRLQARDYRNDFICEVISRIIENEGLEFTPLSFDLMEPLTQIFTAEWCIRPYLDHKFEELELRLETWMQSDNHHLRRLVSEGTRPTLPWGKKLQKLDSDPFFAIPYLLKLAGNESEYVRKSVSNHLNDFWKKHPNTAIEVCQELVTDNRISDKDLRQALRNLIKEGNPDALALVGVEKFKGSIQKFQHPNTVALGKKLDVQLELSPQKKQKIEVDYVLGFQRKDGSHGKKVFKGNRTENKENRKLTLAFSLPIKPISTRKYYEGIQKIAVQVNGEILAESEFYLEF